MFRRWFTLRTLLALVSVGLILAGLSRMVKIRTRDRPAGTAAEIPELAKRKDLNIVFVLIDTLRADRLHSFGYKRPTSPVMDGLAASGIRFTNVLSQSTWTKCSMASMWTSSYPAANGVTRYPHGLPEAATLPAEILHSAGYRTVGIWRNGWVAPNFGFGQGFDLYFRPPLKPGGRVRQDNPSAFSIPGTDEDATRSAVAFLKNVGNERFFLYVHYMDVHQYVYDDSANFGTTYSDIYDNAIHWVDKNVGALVGALQSKKLMHRTIFVVAADHGEAFEEHGTEGHARNLYIETTHVPLLIALPFRLDKAIEVKVPAQNVDIWPTLFDLAGLPSMQGAQGISLVPAIEAAARGDGDDHVVRARYSQLDTTWGQRGAKPHPLVSVEEGDYRLFERPEHQKRAELYNVAKDYGEHHDIAKDNPKEVAHLRGLLDDYLNEPKVAWGDPKQVPLGDFELNQLRALGYAVGGKAPGAKGKGKGARKPNAGAKAGDSGK